MPPADLPNSTVSKSSPFQPTELSSDAHQDLQAGEGGPDGCQAAADGGRVQCNELIARELIGVLYCLSCRSRS